MVSLVGYTNAGKSTLFNRLTEAGVLVEDRLFATLDSTVRRLALPGGKPVLVGDTVGFVRRLPHQLVEAFRSTLEEVAQSALLVHVVDASSPDPDGQIDAVHVVLRQIGAGTVDELLVVNKTDVADPVMVDRLMALHPGAVAVSAASGDGMDRLLDAVAASLEGATTPGRPGRPLRPGRRGGEAARDGRRRRRGPRPAGTRLRVKLPKLDADRFVDYQAT